MFSKAKVKRFNDEISCAPPPTKYDPKVKENTVAYSIDKSDRWNEQKMLTPGPGDYTTTGALNPPQVTPMKGKLSSHLNSSVSSTNSASSQHEFGVPQSQPFSRSKSWRSSQNKKVHNVDLKSKLERLENEKQKMQQSIVDLEKQLSALEQKEAKQFSDSSTQVELETQTDESIPDEPEDLSCKKPALDPHESELLREQISHLTRLRDNLESSVAVKENTIADLRMQIDLVVADAEAKQTRAAAMEERAMEVEKELEKSILEKEREALNVRDLVSKYEALTQKHQEICSSHKEIMAQKDIEIELLNDSLYTLNTQVSEYERTVCRIQSEVNLKKFQIYNLETTLGDLSIASKEKEVVETILEDEIQEKSKEVSKLEFSLLDMEEKLELIRKDRESLVQKMHTEKLHLETMEEKMKHLEMNLKEKEVVQQFLEKEVASREAEVHESNNRVKELEKDLEMARKVAMDLQEEAEVQLHELFCLKASLSATEYDLENKEDMINSLKGEVTEKDDVQTVQKLKEELESKEKEVQALEKNINHLKSALDKEEENTSQLEERVVQLMVDFDEREAEHKQSLMNKESEIEELSVKYSDSLLEQESTKRLLTNTVENLNKESLIRQATHRELESVRVAVSETQIKYDELENSYKELSHKLIHIEDALACEEAESREIQKKLDSTKDQLEMALEENTALNSCLNGYTAQISMLKVDMSKKSSAVEQMQQRIDELREEKSYLQEEKTKMVEEIACLHSTIKVLEATTSEKTRMVTDLQNDLESKMKTVTDMELKMEEKEDEIFELTEALRMKTLEEEKQVTAFEEEKGVFFEHISSLESELKNEEEQKAVYKTKIIELEGRLTELEETKEVEVQTIQGQLKEEKVKTEDLKRRYNQLQQKYEAYEDQLINLQTSLADKTSEAEKWNQSFVETSTVSESYREKVEELKSDISKLVRESEQLSRSLQSKDALFTTLNDSISVKSEEIHSLNKVMEDKETKISDLERRLNEMNQVVSCLKEERERADSRLMSLQKSFDLTKEELEKKTEFSQQEMEEGLARHGEAFRVEISQLTVAKETIEAETQLWRRKFETLERMTEPFMEQLEAYELEKSMLLSKSSAAEEEVRKLSDEYAKLLGHNNHKQKIQHVVKLKTENTQLKERLLRLQTELEKQKTLVRKLDDSKVQDFARGRPTFSASKSNLLAVPSDFEDKENSPVLSSNHAHARAFTPHRSSSLNTKFRRL